MSRVRSFRRAFGIAVAMLVPLWLLQPLGCATGGSADSDSGLGTADYDGEPPADTGPRPDGTPPGFDSAPPPFDGGVDTGHAIDAGVMDSGGMDTSKPHKDAGPKDSGAPDTGSCVTVTVSSTGGSPVSCTPTGSTCGDIGTIGTLPAWVPPTGLHQNFCTTAQMNDIYASCLAPTATATACAMVQTTAAACYSCMFTPQTASSYGPVIQTTTGVPQINQAGCVALLEPCNLSCAEALLGAFQCEGAACAANCSDPLTTSESFDYETCIDTAAGCDPQGCDSYVTRSSCTVALTGVAHPASVCVMTSTSTFEAAYNAIGPLFCGK